jgi:hypothetical protein
LPQAQHVPQLRANVDRALPSSFGFRDLVFVGGGLVCGELLILGKSVIRHTQGTFDGSRPFYGAFGAGATDIL